MTLKAISIAPSNYQNPVELDRTLVDTLAGKVAGVIFETFADTMAELPELQVAPGVGHTVTVGPGKAVLREKTNPEIRGGYYVQNDAVEVVDLPVPQSNPFIATIVLRVADPQYGTVTGAVGPRIDVVSGTPASSPVAESDGAIDAVVGTPGGWIRLADVRINSADVGAVPAGQITDKRTPGGFGEIACLSTNRPLVTKPGHRIFEMDRSLSQMWDGTKWLGLTVEPWIELPIVTTASWETVVNYTNRLRCFGPMVWLEGAVRYKGTGATSEIVNIPEEYRPEAGAVFIAAVVASSGWYAELYLNTLTGAVSVPAGYAGGSLPATGVVPLRGMWMRA